MSRFEEIRLSPFQHRNMLRAANHPEDGAVFFAPESLPEDKAEARWEIDRNLREMQELVELKMLEDISSDYQASIDANLLVTGRRFFVFKISDLGQSLYHDLYGHRTN